MNKYGIIGALLFVCAVVAGYFFNFAGSVVIEIGLAAFGLCAVVMGAIKGGKDKGVKTWKIVVVIALAVIGGVLCCIGGLSQNIFTELSGAALALLAVIFGVIYAYKEKQ